VRTASVELGCEPPHPIHPPVEHDLDRILDEAVLEGDDLVDDLHVPRPIRRAGGVLPVHAARHDLTGGRPIEDDGRVGPVRSGALEHRTRHGCGQEARQQAIAIHVLDDRAVAHHEQHRQAESGGDRPCEVERAARHERHLDTGGQGRRDRPAVVGRNLALAVEQRTVDVDGDEADGHCDLGAWRVSTCAGPVAPAGGAALRTGGAHRSCHTAATSSVGPLCGPERDCRTRFGTAEGPHRAVE
jgi:hypothetical protein